MRIYFETSAFMKILLGEPEADLARAAWADADRIATSLITYTEARATLAAAVRNGTLATDEASVVRSTLERMWGQCDIVAVTDAIASFAGDLAETWRLRSLDAIHLASVLEVADDRTVFQTWDRRLAFAARSIGLAVAGIEA